MGVCSSFLVCQRQRSEIKHDGYRLIVRRDGNRGRLYTRRGYNWSHRFPLVSNAAMRLKVRSAIIDGEAVVCGADGRSDFDKLHSQGYDQGRPMRACDSYRGRKRRGTATYM